MKYKAVIFDMDGTILNTLQDLTDATNFALKSFDMPERTIEEVRTFVGNGVKKLIERAVPENTSCEKTDQVLSRFLEYYSKHSNDNTCSYPGIQNLVVELKKLGIKTAVCTNKPDAPANALGKKYFDGLFDLILGQKEGLKTKPAPDGVNEILSIMNINRKDAVYIGDSDVDFETARNSDMDFIGVDWGFKGRKFLEALGAKTVVSSADEILDICR